MPRPYGSAGPTGVDQAGPTGVEQAPTRALGRRADRARRRRGMWIGAAALVAGAVVVALVGGQVRGEAPAAQPTPAPTTASPSPAPMPEPTLAPPVEIPADPTVYDTSALVAVGPRQVIEALPVDSAPLAPATTTMAAAAGASAPVFAEPGQAPVAVLLAEHEYGGVTVPVVEQHENWVKVLLPTRSGLPSAGVVGQTAGWLRTSDVALDVNTRTVQVSLSTPQITILDGATTVYSTSDFGYGAAKTPTPIGRTFLMTSFVDPGASYARGLEIFALAVHSPTLDGFGGQAVAVTAFHFHSSRSGALSNGCLRVGEETIAALAELPLGTVVMVTA